MNVTDLAVGPDGALYFTMGGRGSQGGVYRITYETKLGPTSDGSGFVNHLQPFSAFGRSPFASSATSSRRRSR